MPLYGRWLKRLRGSPVTLSHGCMPGHGALLQQRENPVGNDLVRFFDLCYSSSYEPP